MFDDHEENKDLLSWGHVYFWKKKHFTKNTQTLELLICCMYNNLLSLNAQKCSKYFSEMSNTNVGIPFSLLHIIYLKCMRLKNQIFMTNYDAGVIFVRSKVDTENTNMV